MAPRFKYKGGDRKVEDVSRRAKQSGGGFDSWLSSDCTFYKAKEGDCSLRIMPRTWEDEKWGNGWHIEVFVHYGVGPDNGAYLCTDKMQGKRCPICEARRDSDNEDEADALRPSWRALCWVIDRDNERAGPQVMSMPVTLFREVNARSIDKETDSVIYIDDPDKGFDVLFSREGTDKRTKYANVEVARKSSYLNDNEKKQDDWLNFILDHPLPDMLIFFPPEHIEKVLFGKADRSTEKERDDERTSDRASTRRSSRQESDEEPDRRSRRGGGDDEGDDSKSSARRSRSEEPEEEPERGSRRRRSEAAEDEPSVGRRSSRDESGEEDTGGRQSRRSASEEGDADPPSRRGRSEGESTSRRGGKEDPPAEDDPTEQARTRLSRIQRRSSK